MDSASELLGNPLTLLIERLVYLSIGIFFIVAFYRGVKRNLEDK